MVAVNVSSVNPFGKNTPAALKDVVRFVKRILGFAAISAIILIIWSRVEALTPLTR